MQNQTATIKSKKAVRCKNRLPITRKICGEILYRSDGNILEVENLEVNPKQNKRNVICPKCGGGSVWKRNSKFL